MSRVTDTTSQDHNIIPPGQFAINVGAIPERGALSLFALAAAGWGVLVYCRRSRNRVASIKKDTEAKII